ncbi:transglutaminase-like domain-containing protein [Cytophagaceae bacterium DM2B3-1]|uniref:Transglutaminase-like domain-containing protein n=1 Tax=Xanthocytophaga flava TaxID=3048013 RepID=A0AAE3UAC9_9BACT|nr:transglutaminase-like domain-containing protein [Xanthocytophaga flavus]MDJ1484562.1 transglutaminase-like domain-containing protein [Xanthocytophaga flavus]MDJ1498355.1 transglutaminase-like domain-containing protein [Xanthocytophaga flavus]
MNTNEIKALVSLLDDDDKEVQLHVEQRIISLGGPVIPFLEAEWETNFNPIVQKKIEELIHTLQFDALKQRLREWKDSETQDLLEGMWLVATYQYPDLSLERLKKDLEQIYYDAWLEFKADVHAYDQVKILNSVMFSKLKFAANTKNFHSPANCMINIVLDSKRGNPISLCVIYMLIAHKLKLPIYGVNLPNLFILTFKTADTQFYINVFNKGIVFSRSDIDSYIKQLNLPPSDIFYEPCSNVDIIKRVLRNLSLAFEKTGDNDKMEEVRLLLDVVTENKEEE